MLSQCDECGRQVTKLTRTYRGRGYCATCYARAFKPRACPACGTTARLLAGVDDAVCRSCERGHPCARCGAAEYAIGRITPYGPVCNSCSTYFREARACGICGQLTRRLSRVSRLGIELPVCPNCQESDYATCALCRRYRQLRLDRTGRSVCRSCEEGGLVPCPQCREMMPAGRGSQCELCYWTDLLTKRVAMALEQFSRPSMQELFRQFGDWLSRRVGAHKAAITVNRYLPFFQELAQLGDVLLNADLLLEHFTTQGLRRNLLPMQFLEDVRGLVVDGGAKEQASERRRIADLLQRLPKDGNAQQMLLGYQTALMEKVTSTGMSLRSVRLALLPATSVLLLMLERRCAQPTQEVLAEYIEHAPGQRAALSGFVRYLREVHEVNVHLPKRKKPSERLARSCIEAKLATMLANGAVDMAQQRTLLELALQYFHGLSEADALTVCKASSAPVNVSGDWALIHEGRSYWVPPEVGSMWHH